MRSKVRAVTDAKDDEKDDEGEESTEAEEKAEGDESSEAKKDEDESAEEGEERSSEAKKSDDDEGASEEDEDEEEEEEEEDEASPEAIARRVAALGEEDEVERIAREEEQKLAERKAKRRGKKGGGALEVAASKRLAKIGKKAKPKREVESAIEAVDPVIERGMRAEEWAKKNQKVVWGIVAAAVLGLLGYAGVAYMNRQKSIDASMALAEAVHDEQARIGDPAKDPGKEDDDDTAGPMFKTYDERREAALGKYREVSSKFPSTGAATLARLGEASVLLDKRDADGAAAAYGDVIASPLGKADNEVMGRALEGLGFAYEAKALATPADKDKDLDLALQQFKALENTDVAGFKELGMYHQARCYESKGDKAKAVEVLKQLHERLDEPGANHPLPYLEELADDRLRRLDPSALPPKESGMLGGGPHGKSLTPAQLKQLFEQHPPGQK